MTIDQRLRELLLTANSAEVADHAREQARTTIVELHIGLVEMAARRYSDRGEPFDDLMQVGSIGLLKAIERFDPERGTQFSTYAVPTIIGEIKRHFRDRGWSVTVPRRLRELSVRLRPARSELHQKLGREPTTAELAEHLSVDPEEVLEALESAQAYSSLSLETPRDSDGGQLLDTLGRDDRDLSIVIARETLRPALEALEPRQRQIVVMRFFGGRTQSQIGEALGISQVQVSRILSKTLEQLRLELADED
jgi:RNA polymerase sigma-B factor